MDRNEQSFSSIVEQFQLSMKLVELSAERLPFQTPEAELRAARALLVETLLLGNKAVDLVDALIKSKSPPPPLMIFLDQN